MSLDELIQRIESRGWRWSVGTNGRHWVAIVAIPHGPMVEQHKQKSQESAARALGMALQAAEPTTVPRANHVSEGLAAHTCDVGTSQEINTRGEQMHSRPHRD